MNPVSALGVASTAIQFVDFDIKILRLCKEVRDSAKNTTAANAELEDQIEIMKNLQDDMNNGISSASLSSYGSKRIIKIATDCNLVSNDLIHVQETVQGCSSSRLLRTVQATCRAPNEKRTIEKLERKSNEQNPLLDSAVLSDIRKAFNSLQRYQKNPIHLLQTQQQNLIESQEQTQDKLESFIRKSHLALRNSLQSSIKASEEHLTNNLSHIERHIETLPSDLANDTVMKLSHHIILKSLLFSEPFLKKERKQAPYTATFDWVVCDENANLFSCRELLKTLRKPCDSPSWLRTGDSVYWVNGTAGSGKIHTSGSHCQS